MTWRISCVGKKRPSWPTLMSGQPVSTRTIAAKRLKSSWRAGRKRSSPPLGKISTQYKVFLQEKGSQEQRGHLQALQKAHWVQHTTQQEWFQELVRIKLVHAWEWEGLNLGVLSVNLNFCTQRTAKPWKHWQRANCTHQGRVTVEGGHVTHVLKLLGDRQLWLAGCGGQLSLKTQKCFAKTFSCMQFQKGPQVQGAV